MIWKNIVTPMLLGEVNKPFNSNDYIYEIKFDGIRALLYIDKDIQVYNRHKVNITNIYPELQNIKKLIKGKVILDGEIVIFKNSKPSFSSLSKKSHLKDKTKINNQSINNPVVFVCFDILYKNKDITNLPLMKRKEILDKYKENEYFVKSFYIENNGIELFNLIKKENMEGIVAKKKNSIYDYNNRSNNWLKIKNLKMETFFIGGYSYKDTHVFSAYLGEYKNNNFIFVGKVFIAKKYNIFNEVLKQKKTSSYFKNFDKENVTYIKPIIKCKIKYLERTPNNNLRQPIFLKEEDWYK